MAGQKIASFKERFAELVSSCGKSQSSIAADFGVAKQTISAWITGQTSPRSPVLSALADYFGVSVVWLMGYDVPKYPEKKEATENFLSQTEKDLVSYYRAAAPSARSSALLLLKASADEQQQKRKDTESGQTA